MKKRVELEPGWYRVLYKGEKLFREKRPKQPCMYNQRGYVQFFVSDYEILEKVTLTPMPKADYI